MYSKIIFLSLAEVKDIDVTKTYAIIGACKVVADKYNELTLAYDNEGHVVIAFESINSEAMEELNKLFYEFNVDLQIEL